MVARREGHGLLVRPQRQLRHLDARHRQRGDEADQQQRSRGSPAQLVDRRRAHRLCRHRWGEDRPLRHHPRGRKGKPAQAGGGQDRRPLLRPERPARLCGAGRDGQPSRHRRQDGQRHRKCLPLPRQLGEEWRLLLCLGRQDPQPQGHGAVHRGLRRHARSRKARLCPRQTRLGQHGPAQGAGHRPPHPFARRQPHRLRRARRSLCHAGQGRRAGKSDEGRRARHRSRMVARWQEPGLHLRQGRRPAATVDTQSCDRQGSSPD